MELFCYEIYVVNFEPYSIFSGVKIKLNALKGRDTLVLEVETDWWSLKATQNGRS
jgi:hypothetical protein